MTTTKQTLLSLAILAGVYATPTVAEETEEASNLAISAELGLLFTSGNTESSSVYGNITATHDLDKWKNKYTFDILNKENEVLNAEGEKVTQKTDDRFKLTGQADYKLSETSSVFVFGSYAETEFGAYASYATLAGGYSFRPVEKPNMFLDLNVGGGYTEAEDQAGVSDDGAVLRGSAAFEWKVTETAKFIQNISVESAEFNTRTITETAVTAALSTQMQMKLGFKTTTDSDVADGVEKTDTETSVTIVVNF